MATETDVAAPDTKLAMLAMASFLFGLLVAFAIDGTRDRVSRLQEALKRSDANILAIYNLMNFFGEDAKREMRCLLDRQLQDQIDHKLTDLHRSRDSYLAIVRGTGNLSADDDREAVALDHVISQALDLGENRAVAESLVRQRITPLEWAGLALLVAVQVLILVSITGPSALGVLMTGVMTGVLGLLLALLRLQDQMRINETRWIWNPLTRLFRSLDLLPYYSAEVIESGRFRPTGRYRMGRFVSGEKQISERTADGGR